MNNTENFVKDWTPIPQEEKLKEETSGSPLTYWQDVRRRFVQNKVAVVSLFIIIVLVLLSVFGPLMTGKDYYSQDLVLRKVSPILTVYEAADGTNLYVHPDVRLFVVNEDGYIGEELQPVGGSLLEHRFEYEYNGATYILEVGEGIRLLDGNSEPITDSHRSWNRNNLLGTDNLGRDMLTRLLYGGRISLGIAFVVAICTLVIGVLYGGVAGYFGGNVDTIMMRIVEILMSVPNTIYVILLMVYFGRGLLNILIAMAVTSWLGMARLVRGQVLSLKKSDYVLAARSVGTRPIKIILQHLLPNCIGPIIVSAAASIPGAIATEAFMSLIGIGVAPPMPSWGLLNSEGLAAIQTAPYQIFLPSFAISLTMFAFNFLGDGLRDALDPRLRK